jgi:hypothetical protein
MSRPERHILVRQCCPKLELLESRCLLNTGGADSAQVAAAYGELPLSFEANQGQTDAQVRFLSRGDGYSLFLTPSAAVLSLSKPLDPGSAGQGRPASAQGTALFIQMVGANPAAQVVGEDSLPGTSNYFIGNDPSHWHTTIPTYSRVKYQGVYRGIDLVYYGNQRQLEYDFVVAPGGNPGAIHLAFQGADSLALDGAGNLVLHTPGGAVVEHAPVVYQGTAGAQQPVAGRYVLEGAERVGFVVGAYDASRPLVIDPVLSYSTYVGGSNSDWANSIAVDLAGNAYITGYASSTNFPVTAGVFQTSNHGYDNAFVTKLNGAGTALDYSTYLGGSAEDGGLGIAVDAAGNAYVTGGTNSSDFPTTAGAFQTRKPGDSSAFVTKLNPTGTALAYSTYLGGSTFDDAYGIAVDAVGNAYVTGRTESRDFPTTDGAFQTSNHVLIFPYDTGFVTKLNVGGTALVYSTYLGGTVLDEDYAIALDAAGDAYVTGYTDSTDFPVTAGAFQTSNHGRDEAFVSKLNTVGRALDYSTYLGGSGLDQAYGIAADTADNAYVTGVTSSRDFPTTAGAFQTSNHGGDQAFVTKLNNAGTALDYSTYLGGRILDDAYGIAVDVAGCAYITGRTADSDFPVTVGAYQTTNRGSFDAFVTKLNNSGTALDYSTYLGGGRRDYGEAIAVDGSGHAYVAGYTASTNFPTTADAFQTSNHGAQNAFVTKFTLPGPATHLAVTVPAGATAGIAFGVTVIALDANDNTATGYTGTVHFSSADPYGAVLPADYAFSASDGGMHTFPAGATLYTAGTWDITATETADDTITGSDLVTVTPAPAVAFVITAPASVASATPFDITVTAVDPYGNTDVNYQGTVTFSTTDPDPGVLLPAVYPFQPGDMGVAYFPDGVTLITPGDQSITATDTADGTITGSATVTVTGTDAFLAIGAGVSQPAPTSPAPTTSMRSEPSPEPAAVDWLFSLVPERYSMGFNRSRVVHEAGETTLASPELFGSPDLGAWVLASFASMPGQ